MITPPEIKAKAERQYVRFLSSWFTNEPFFPLIIPVGQRPKDFTVLKAASDLLHKHSKERIGYGYALIVETIDMQRFGRQVLPTGVSIESEADFLKLIGKVNEFARFQSDTQLIVNQLPALREWISHHPLRIIEYAGNWNDLIKVCLYFQMHPLPNLYVRELPIAVHTKFVEQHQPILKILLDVLLGGEVIRVEEIEFEKRFGLRYDEPMIRVRFLDNQLEKMFGLPVTDLSVPLSEFKRLAMNYNCCIVVENKMSFLTLPKLPATIAIWGKGFNVELLDEVKWLHENRILYWGDIDSHGFQILSTLRRFLPQAESILMDVTTFEDFRSYVVQGTPTSARMLPGLSVEEHTLFEYLSQQNLRLEQEHIAYKYSIEHIMVRVNAT